MVCGGQAGGKVARLDGPMTEEETQDALLMYYGSVLEDSIRADLIHFENILGPIRGSSGADRAKELLQMSGSQLRSALERGGTKVGKRAGKKVLLSKVAALWARSSQPGLSEQRAAQLLRMNRSAMQEALRRAGLETRGKVAVLRERLAEAWVAEDALPGGGGSDGSDGGSGSGGGGMSGGATIAAWYMSQRPPVPAFSAAPAPAPAAAAKQKKVSLL